MKWLVTFAIDLKEYELRWNKLDDEMNKLGAARIKLAQKYTGAEKYPTLFYSLELETSIMEAKWKDMRNYLKRN